MVGEMRRLFLPAALVVASATACTTILGNFDIGGAGPGTSGDAGPDGAGPTPPPPGSDSGMPGSDAAMPGFVLTAPMTFAIIRGTAASLDIDVTRTAFPADITLTLSDLPTLITLTAPATNTLVLKGGQTHAIFPLQAAGNAALGKFSMTVKATSPGVPDQTAAFTLLSADPPGSLDLTFGGSGVKALGGGAPEAVVVQDNGAVVVGGVDSAPGPRLVRYLENGTDDVPFNTAVASSLPAGGRVHGVAIRSLVPSNPQIVVAAQTPSPHFVVQVYNHDGSLDTTFGNGGTVEVVSQGTQANAVAVDSQQRIVAVGVNGSAPYARRLATNGAVSVINVPAVPAAYAGAAVAPRAVTIGPADDIWISGTITPTGSTHAFVAHVTPALQPDITFGVGGMVVLGADGTYTEGRGLARFPTGEIGISGNNSTVGSSSAYGMVAPDGGLPVFDVDGGLLFGKHGSGYDFGYNGATMQPDGRIILTGGRGSNTKSHPYYERRFVDGGVDLIGDAGIVDYVVGNPCCSSWNAAAVARDGRIVVAGADDAGWIVARYWP
jgi:uncharacterized delta-60 repeat protein